MDAAAQRMASGRHELGASANLLAAYVAVLRRRWMVVVAGTAAAFALAAMFVAVATPVFEATATVQVISPRAAEAGGRSTPIARTKTLLESQALASRVVEDLRLQQPPRFLSPERLLAHHLTVSEVRSTEFLRVAVRLSDPELAARVANRTAELGITLSREQNVAETKAVRLSLVKQLEAARAHLVQARGRILPSRAGSARPVIRERLASPEPLGERELGSATVEEIDYDVVRRIYVDLAFRHETLLIEEAVRGADFRISDPARRPQEQVYPRRTRMLAVGLLAGLIVSVVAAFFYDAVADGRPGV